MNLKLSGAFLPGPRIQRRAESRNHLKASVPGAPLCIRRSPDTPSPADNSETECGRLAAAVTCLTDAAVVCSCAVPSKKA